MKPDAHVCSWRELRVVRVGGGRVSAARARAVLVYWRDHGLPPTGYTVVWPEGKKTVSDMYALGEVDE